MQANRATMFAVMPNITPRRGYPNTNCLIWGHLGSRIKASMSSACLSLILTENGPSFVQIVRPRASLASVLKPIVAMLSVRFHNTRAFSTASDTAFARAYGSNWRCTVTCARECETCSCDSGSDSYDSWAWIGTLGRCLGCRGLFQAPYISRV